MPKTIIVKVNGKPYETHIVKGVQRFKVNKLCRFLVDSGMVSLNTLAIAYANKNFTKREYMEFKMAIGYLVSGFEELSFNAKIENPLWK